MQSTAPFIGLHNQLAVACLHLSAIFNAGIANILTVYDTNVNKCALSSCSLSGCSLVNPCQYIVVTAEIISTVRARTSDRKDE